MHDTICRSIGVIAQILVLSIFYFKSNCTNFATKTLNNRIKPVEETGR